MAYVCLNAQEMRVFVKNGKLRLQARKLDEAGEVAEQITISFPKEMAHYFTQVEDFDAQDNFKGLDRQDNRLKDLLNDN